MDTLANATLTANLKGEGYTVADNGLNVWPRFEVIEAPKVGDAVCAKLGGDLRSDGEIVSVSPSLKVIRTSTGSVYRRRRSSAVWLRDRHARMVIGEAARLDSEF